MKNLLFPSLLLLLAVACVKQPETIPAVDSTVAGDMKDLVAPENFSWSTEHSVSLAIQLKAENGCSLEDRVVDILDENYNRISRSFSENLSVSQLVSVPSSVKQVNIYLPQEGVMKAVSLNSGQASYTVNIPCKGSGLAKKPSASFKSGEAGCAVGCDREESGDLNSLEVKNGDVVCLTGNLSGDLTFKNGGELRICGNATIQNLNINGNGDVKIEIGETGTLTASNFNVNPTSAVINNYGVVSFSQTLSVNCTYNNYGDFNISGGLNINGQGAFVNHQDLNVSGTCNVNDGFENHGTFSGAGHFNANGESHVINTCKMTIAGDFQVNNLVNQTGGLIDVNGRTTINGGGKYNTANGAMLNTRHLTINGAISNSGSVSLTKVAQNTSINGGASISGSYDLCDENGIETNNASFGPNVVYCESYIAISGCNTVGYGTPDGGDGATDTDGDGVPDDLDAFPNDPDRSFADVYPYAGYAINGYEDLWPSTGDYDFNDLVIKYKLRYQKNAANQIVGVSGEVIVNAAGGSIKKGLGVQVLNKTVNGSNVNYQKVAGNVIASGTGISGNEGNNTVRLFDNIFTWQKTYYSNVEAQHVGTPDTLLFELTFNPGSVPASPYLDFFIFRTEDRGNEVHLPNRPATASANTGYFGTFEDRTNQNNKWYKDENKRPWGVEIINGNDGFKHPLTKISIADAYPEFLSWVSSNGNNNQDWYKRPVSSKVFTVQ